MTGRAAMLSLAMVLAAAASAAGGELEATLTDTLDIKMRLNAVAFKVRPASTADGHTATLDHLPLTSDGKSVQLWLTQIETATFTPEEGGNTAVKAVLQGKRGDLVEGVVENTTRCYFEGKIAEGTRAGRVVQFPLAEVKALKNHTRYAGSGKPRTILPMPGPKEDRFWVSSVPVGAEVWAKAFDCPEARVWGEYRLLGRTPLTQALRPGKYAVKVVVPDALARDLQPAFRLGEEANPFEHDGWGEVHFRRDGNLIESVTYTVMKKAEKPATLIALFQKRGQSFEDVLKGFPEGYNFHFSDKKLTAALAYNEVPEASIPGILDALHRGGKVIWHGRKRSFMITILPGGTWDLTFAQRPSEK